MKENGLHQPDSLLVLYIMFAIILSLFYCNERGIVRCNPLLITIQIEINISSVNI